MSRTGQATATGSRNDGLIAAMDLLHRARGTLEQASHAGTTNDRYIEAHLGALRAAAALIAVRRSRVRPGRRGRLRTVWDEVAELAPELGEWSAYFAVCGHRRAAVEAGGHAGAREADDLLRAGQAFLGLIQAALGVPVTRGASVLAVTGRP